MTLSLLTPPGTAPSRSQTAEQFNTNADAFVVWLATLVSQLNGAVPDLNQLMTLAQPAIDAATTALQAPGTMASSTTSVTLPTALPTNLSFTIEPGKLLVAGMTLDAIATAAPDNHVVGKIVSYNSSTGALVLRATVVEGSGTWTSWTLALAPLPLTTTRNPLVVKTSSFALSAADKGNVFNVTTGGITISFASPLANVGTDFYVYVLNESASAIFVADDTGAVVRAVPAKTAALVLSDGALVRVMGGASNSERASVRGLTGNVNASVPLTRFDLSASSVTLLDARGNSVMLGNTGTQTCNLSQVGPAANGRDISGAFSANSWIYLYFIWNGSAIATLASAQPPSPTVGPTLPAGYTHWAYATTIRWNGSSNIVPAVVRGSTVSYTIAQAALSNGSAGTETPVPLASYIPPSALNAQMLVRIGATANASPTIASVGLRIAAGASDFLPLDVCCPVAGQSGINTAAFSTPNVGTIYYQTNANGAASIGVNLSVLSFAVPNGDN